jgi:hypothetical protein
MISLEVQERKKTWTVTEGDFLRVSFELQKPQVDGCLRLLCALSCRIQHIVIHKNSKL